MLMCSPPPPIPDLPGLPPPLVYVAFLCHFPVDLKGEQASGEMGWKPSEYIQYPKGIAELVEE